MKDTNEIITVNNKEYKIVKLLGKGKGGYSYLATNGFKDFVVKQIHHEPCDYYQFGNKLEAEQHDYERLHATDLPIPTLLEIDVKNERILKEYVCGDTIFDLVLHDQMEDSYWEQIRIFSDNLKKAKINIDYFPTNFIVQDKQLFYIDYECNDYMDEWSFDNWGQKYWSKTPEFMEYVATHLSDK